jgi:methyltransferase family protein
MEQSRSGTGSASEQPGLTQSRLSRALGCYRTLRRGAGRIRRACSMLPQLPHIVRILIFKGLHRSDYGRWGNPDNLERRWDSRTRQLAQLIPKDSRVIEFGAGRRQLELYLDASCAYVPSDLIDRGPDTVVCDLNRRPLPDLRHLQPDVAVFSGVLEYISDLPSLLRWLSTQVSFCVTSYVYAQSRPKTIQRREEVLRRAYTGFMNTYTEDELVALFRRSGFIPIKAEDTWGSQRLFLFRKSTDGAGS